MLMKSTAILAMSLMLSINACKSKDKSKGGSHSPNIETGTGTSNGGPGIKMKQSDKASVEEFRNIFATFAKDKYSEPDMQKLVYLPPEDLLNVKLAGATPHEALQNLTSEFKKFKPSSLYNHGKTVAINAGLNVTESLNKSGPITLVIVPGIFSEFIETYPFYELIEGSKSSLSVKLEEGLKAKAPKTDPSWDFDKLAEVETPMTSLVKGASVDNEKGEALINVLVLTSPMFSGETIGKLDENATVYLRRLNKIFESIGTPENIVFVGYSRGAPVALEMIAQVEKQSLAWAPKLKGMVSLGGVLYGAAMADAAFDAKDPMNGLLTTIQGLIGELEMADEKTSTSTALLMATRNSGRWLKASGSLAAQAVKLPLNEGLALEEIRPSMPHVESNLSMLRSIAFERFDLSDPSRANYFMNIKKFKWILNRAIDGLDSIRTDSRVAWYQANILPNRVKYFAVNGVMGDVSTKAGGVWDLTRDDAAFQPKALDYLALRMSYYDLFRVSGLEVTDSQVSMERSRFLPELQTLLNPKQPLMNTYYMGVLGVDHWGMAFPYAVRTQAQLPSPYPRTLVAKSIAEFVSRHLAD